MIEYRKGNLLDVSEGIIIHGCNAQGVMGSGVAKAIKEKYPKAYEVYVVDIKYGMRELGYISWYNHSKNFWIGSALTQEKYGRDPSVRYVSYDAIDIVFKTLAGVLDLDNNPNNLVTHIPKIGAGLGNGLWDVISTIINNRMKNNKVICWEL